MASSSSPSQESCFLIWLRFEMKTISKTKQRQKLEMDKSVFGRVKLVVCNPFRLVGVVLRRVFSRFIRNDELFIKWEYYLGMHKWPNLKTPKTYNEKLQWMKLYDHNPDYVRMVDKAMAKEWVKEKLGTDEYCIPTLGVYNTFSEIDFSDLPNQFVLKTTHDSGGVVVCRDKLKLDMAAAQRILNHSLNHDYFLQHREWPYKHVPRKIIVEQYLEDTNGGCLKDYKFFCFDGEPKFMFIASDRGKDTRFDFFDIEFNHLPVEQGHPNSDHQLQKPVGWDKMIDIARKLSKGMYHVRVDLYDIDGRIYFGEMTLFHFSGNVPFEPEEWDNQFGEMLHLPAQFNDTK